MNWLYASFKLLFLVLLLYSCNQKAAIVDQADLVETNPLDTMVMDTIHFQTDTIAEEENVVEILSYAKTPCFGKCPVFSFEMMSDGTVFYRGRENVDQIGLYTSSVSEEVMEAFKQEAVRVGFFELANIYPENEEIIQDLPKHCNPACF